MCDRQGGREGSDVACGLRCRGTRGTGSCHKVHVCPSEMQSDRLDDMCFSRKLMQTGGDQFGPLHCSGARMCVYVRIARLNFPSAGSLTLEIDSLELVSGAVSRALPCVLILQDPYSTNGYRSSVCT